MLTTTDIAAAQQAILKNKGFKPNILVANGAVLNRILGVTTYDTCKAYRVTTEGITEVVE